MNLLCKGMYGFEYLLKEVAMKYKTKVVDYFLLHVLSSLLFSDAYLHFGVLLLNT